MTIITGNDAVQRAAYGEVKGRDEDSDEDEDDGPENGVRDRIDKALVSKATRAKERISKRVRC